MVICADEASQIAFGPNPLSPTTRAPAARAGRNVGRRHAAAIAKFSAMQLTTAAIGGSPTMFEPPIATGFGEQREQLVMSAIERGGAAARAAWKLIDPDALERILISLLPDEVSTEVIWTLIMMAGSVTRAIAAPAKMSDADLCPVRGRNRSPASRTAIATGWRPRRRRPDAWIDNLRGHGSDANARRTSQGANPTTPLIVADDGDARRSIHHSAQVNLMSDRLIGSTITVFLWADRVTSRLRQWARSRPSRGDTAEQQAVPDIRHNAPPPRNEDAATQ